MGGASEKEKVVPLENHSPVVGFGGQKNPEQYANPLSKLTFWWGNKYVLHLSRILCCDITCLVRSVRTARLSSHHLSYLAFITVENRKGYI